MKKLIYVSFFGVLNLISLKGNCQYNLIPDPSFELYSFCPITVGQIAYLTYWTEPLINVSPDFIHSCNTIGSGIVGVPQNKFGYQHARTGQGYVGIVTAYNNPNDSNYTYREYIQTELTDSLLPGVEYTIRFYVSAADSCGKHTNNIGAYFSNIEIDTSINPINSLPFLPQFENHVTNDISDRIGWSLITDDFIANGGEKYLIIGNFQTQQNTTIVQTGWGTFPPNMITAYLYIDDVLVSPKDSLTSISDMQFSEELSLLTINSNEFEIASKFHAIHSIDIINCLGQVISSEHNINQKNAKLSAHILTQGFYIIRVKLRNHNTHILKMFKP